MGHSRTRAQYKRKDLQKLFGVYWMWRGGILPDWPKFDAIRDIDVAKHVEAIDNVAIKESYAPWFSAIAEEQLGLRNGLESLRQ